MDIYLFGPKDAAWLDVWSIEHILSGMSIGALILGKNEGLFRNIVMSNGLLHHFVAKEKFIRSSREILVINLIAVLMLSFAWESTEHYLETGMAGKVVQDWLMGVEYWGNRLVMDNVMVIWGFFITRAYPVLVAPARILSVIWLVVHIFVFPDSMYLHEVIHDLFGHSSFVKLW